MAKPVLVVVDGEDASLRALTGELEARYGVHYEVASCSSAEVAPATGWRSFPGAVHLFRPGVGRQQLRERGRKPGAPRATARVSG